MKFLDLTGLQHFYDKYLRPLKDAAFKNTANNLTTETEGSVLDARQGKVLNDLKLSIAKVINNLLTTEEGFALDARQGKVLDDKITELNGNKISKYDVSLAAGEVLTGETFGGKPVYMRLFDIGVLPNNTSKTVDTGITSADYFWIDPTYSIIFSAGAAYPLPYVDPTNIANSIAARLIASGQQVVITTRSNWGTYAGFVAVRYTKQ